MPNINDIPLNFVAVFGEHKFTINELKKFNENDIICLDSYAGDTIKLYLNNVFIGEGEMVIANEKYGVKITKLID